jgi:hypothetical protein
MAGTEAFDLFDRVFFVAAGLGRFAGDTMALIEEPRPVRKVTRFRS